MVNFVLIGICIIAGFLFRQSKTLPENAHAGINAWLIYLALPAISFKYLPYIQWSSDLILPVMAPIIVWLGSWAYTHFYAGNTQLSTPSKGAFRLATGLSNTSFIGYPLILAYFGEEYLSTAVICDQVNFLILASLGVTVAIRSSGTGESSGGFILKKVITFPPFLGSVGALTIPHFIDISSAVPLIDKIAVTIGPLALFSIGLQLELKGWRDEIKKISAALVYKLLLAPLLIVIVALLFKLDGKTTQVVILEMAMPCLISAGIVANTYNLHPKFTNLVISIGIVISFLSTAIWFTILEGIF